MHNRMHLLKENMHIFYLQLANSQQSLLWITGRQQEDLYTRNNSLDEKQSSKKFFTLQQITSSQKVFFIF